MASKKKKKANEQPREQTRKEKHLSAKDRERNRRVLIGTGSAIALALLFVVMGVVYEYAYKPSSALATVGEDKIATRDFWTRARLTQNQLENQLNQLVNLEQQFGGQGYFTTQINQIQNILQSPASLGQQTLDEMINDEIVMQEAANRGITVSDEEVDEALRQQVAASLQSVTESQATATADAAVNVTATAAEWTPTPAPTIDVNSPITETIESPTAEAAPTMPILTDESYSEGLAELKTNINNISGMSLSDYKQIIRAGLLREKLQESMASELVQPYQEEVHARHILLEVRDPAVALGSMDLNTIEGDNALSDSSSLTTANDTRTDEETLALAEELRQRIADGEDFAQLAREYSDDTGSAENGGDLGWFGRGAMVPAFEEAAFALAPGEVSQPVKSDFGYHIIEVLERDDQRPKDEATIASESQQAFQNWLLEQSNREDIQRPTDIETKLPSDLTAEPLPVTTQ